jgi:hypothetical protein
MRFAKRLSIGIATVALAGLLGVAIAPKAAHAVASLLVQVTNTTASPVVTTTQTHLGVKAGQIVTLACPQPSQAVLCTASDWVQVPTNGGPLVSFTIPSGQELVITDFEWTLSCCPGESPYSASLLDYVQGTSVDVLNSAPQTTGSLSIGAEHLTAGLVVQSVPAAAVNFQNGLIGNSTASFVIYGYLVPSN